MLNNCHGIRNFAWYRFFIGEVIEFLHVIVISYLFYFCLFMNIKIFFYLIVCCKMLNLNVQFRVFQSRVLVNSDNGCFPKVDFGNVIVPFHFDTSIFPLVTFIEFYFRIHAKRKKQNGRTSS